MGRNSFTLKIMSYNIHSGRDIYMRPRLKQIIQFLGLEQPDIIGLQEVNENNKRGYQFSKIESSLRINGHFAPIVKIGNGYYGIVNFTSFKIIEKNLILLPSKKEQRALLHTTVKINNQQLHLFNTHLGLNADERANQFKKIEKCIQPLKGCHYILMGDLNTAQPNFKNIELIDPAKIMGCENIGTFMRPRKRIDYIFTSPSIEILDYKVFNVQMSDHYPIMATIKIL